MTKREIEREVGGGGEGADRTGKKTETIVDLYLRERRTGFVDSKKGKQCNKY